MSDDTKCLQTMCKLKLTDKADTNKWLLRNHPDTSKQELQDKDKDDFADVTRCFRERKFCSNTNSLTAKKMPSPPKMSAKMSAKMSPQQKTKKRTPQMSTAQKTKATKIYTCMRSVENWAKITSKQKFDKDSFDPQSVQSSMSNASPKMDQLFKIIADQDAADFVEHGKYFKHFIFSDIKEQGYGAKILASAFMARGYTNLITAKKVPNQRALKLALKSPPLSTSKKDIKAAFGVLSSSAVFDAEYTQKFKKEVLDMYNKRPENIHGAQMRFIILDSGFKEGIDLFDVKYVHIFEPSMTIADLKQTIGRATRTCGQKGLPFEPNVGWPLYVYNYFLTVPAEMQAIYQVADKSLLRDPTQSEFLFKDTQKFKDAILLYSQFDKALLNLAEQLYALGPTLSVDFGLTTNIHQVEEEAYLYDDGSQAQSPLLFIKNASPKQKMLMGGKTTTRRRINCAGKCGAKSNKDIPATIPLMLAVYKKYGHDLKQLPRKNQLRPFFCAYLKSNPEYCTQVTQAWQQQQQGSLQKASPLTSNSAAQNLTAQKLTAQKSAQKLTYVLPRSRTITLKKKSPFKQRSSTKQTPLTSNLTAQKSAQKLTYVLPRSRTITLKKKSPAKQSSRELALIPIKNISPIKQIKYDILLYPGKKTPLSSSSVKASPTEKEKASPPTQKLNFKQMRDFIKTHFTGSSFNWQPVELVNKCIEETKKQSVAQTQTNKNIMTFNPTQNFVRHYFVPASPYKGLLLWHSVGTGKTCTAIATATSSFEREGYTILWVTRTTLKSDIWKNMFGQICHTVIAEEIRKGLILPEDEGKRKRLLSKSWVEPMSYKQFSNLLSAQNSYYTDLVARNGKADVIRKTLIIIDEAHKLYGGDLKGVEKPDMAIMERLLQNSYKVSGADSAKLLLMTATPFTNSPMELFQLINLCKETGKDQLIPTDITTFKQRYMNPQNILSPDGIKRLANELTGYISYLNREHDPTQFAQPIMIDVPVMMSHLTDPQLRAELLKQKGDKTDKAQKKAQQKAQQNANAAEVKRATDTLKQKKAALKTYQKTMKAKQQMFEKQCKSTYKKDKAQLAQCMQALKNHAKTNTTDALEAEVLHWTEEVEKLKVQNKTEQGTAKGLQKLLKEKLAALKDSSLQEVALVQRCKSVKA